MWASRSSLADNLSQWVAMCVLSEVRCVLTLMCNVSMRATLWSMTDAGHSLFSSAQRGHLHEPTHSPAHSVQLLRDLRRTLC